MKLILYFFILLLSRGMALAADIKFSSDLQAHFQANACIRCHDFFDKNRSGLAFNTHKDRTPESCAMCHTQKVTGFEHPEEWFARPGVYTSEMNAQKTCETIKEDMRAQFKSKKLIAKEMEHHLLEDARVLWAIEGATQNSGMLPGGKKTEGMVNVGMEEWERLVKSWIAEGMKCD